MDYILTRMTKIAKQLISEGRIKEAITYASSHQLIKKDEGIFLSSKFSQINNQLTKGVITHDAYNTELAKITQSLITLLDPSKLDVGNVLNELERLKTENLKLKRELAFYRDREDNFGGYRFDELYQRISSIKVSPFLFIEMHLKNIGLRGNAINEVINNDGSLDLNRLLYHTRRLLDSGQIFQRGNFTKLMSELASVGLLESKILDKDREGVSFTLTSSGVKYMNTLTRKYEESKM